MVKQYLLKPFECVVLEVEYNFYLKHKRTELGENSVIELTSYR